MNLDTSANEITREEIVLIVNLIKWYDNYHNVNLLDDEAAQDMLFNLIIKTEGKILNMLPEIYCLYQKFKKREIEGMNIKSIEFANQVGAAIDKKTIKEHIKTGSKEFLSGLHKGAEKEIRKSIPKIEFKKVGKSVGKYAVKGTVKGTKVALKEAKKGLQNIISEQMSKQIPKSPKTSNF